MKNKFFLISSLLSLAGYAAAEVLPSPVYVGNQNPFVLIYGLPKAEAGFIAPKGRLEAGFSYFVSNNAFSDVADNGEIMIWDGETEQYSVKLRYGVTDFLELGVDIPYIQHSGGYLDSLIRNFHSFVGFPNDRQEEFDKNQINYEVNGKTYVNDRKHGLGDLRFTAAVPLIKGKESSRRHLALRSVLKLPTGDSDDLLGSGGTDLSAGLTYSDMELLRKLNMVLSANLGMVFLGDSDVLSEMQENFAGYGGVSLDWLALSWLDLKIQFDMHTAIYDTELVQLGSSMQLLAGGTIHFPGDIEVELGISEQVTTDATPDVGFYLMLGYMF